MTIACRVPVRCTAHSDRGRLDPEEMRRRCDGYESVAPTDPVERRMYEANGGLHICRYSVLRGRECIRFVAVIAEWKDTVAP
jgi:hypothetical protein